MGNELERKYGQRITQDSRLGIIEKNSCLKPMELKTDYICCSKNDDGDDDVREWENKYPNSGKANWTEYN